MTAIMKIARYIAIPLFALALLLAQFAPFAQGMTRCGPAHCCCHGVACCCQTPANPNNARQPAAPNRSVTQNDLQVLAAVGEQIFSGGSTPRSSYFRAESSIDLTLIPLYQRNCALLI